MRFTLRVSALALAAMTQAAGDPAYNPATAISISGTVSAVREIPAGQPLEGVHVTLKNKANTFDVYLGPKNFLKFLKTSYASGDELDIVGSRVKNGTADVVLARQVSDGIETLTLRDPNGAEVWKNWGVEVDPATIH